MHVRRLGVQPAEPDQSQHREGSEGRVDVEPELVRRSGERVHAARARRHHVHVELRRDDSGARREDRHAALAIHARLAEGLPLAARLLQNEAEPRDRRQQAHRADDRHADHRAGHEDGHEVVGREHRRLQEPTHLQQRPDRHQRQGARRRRQLLARTREFGGLGPTQEFSRRADASSPATISRRASNCGGSTRSRRPTSLAATPGTTCRTRSAAAAPSGWSGSTTRS